MNIIIFNLTQPGIKELYLHKHYFTKLIIIYDSPCVFKCIFKVVLLMKALEHTGQECARDK